MRHFPSKLGFPSGGFEVFRREAELKPAKLQRPDLAKLAASPAVAQHGLTVALDGPGGFRPAVTDGNRPAIEVRSQGAGAVIFLLAEPLAYFACTLDGATGPVEIRAYGGDDRLVERRPAAAPARAGRGDVSLSRHRSRGTETAFREDLPASEFKPCAPSLDATD